MNKAKNGTVKVGQTVRQHHPEREDIYEDFIVVAVNRKIEKDDVRVVPLQALFACRAVNAADLSILTGEDDEEEKTPTTPKGKKDDGGSKVQALREDGPTLEEYIKSGYKKELYPPKGYAAKDSPGYKELLAEREAAGKV